jgi:hypothetical protein
MRPESFMTTVVCVLVQKIFTILQCVLVVLSHTIAPVSVPPPLDILCNPQLLIIGLSKLSIFVALDSIPIRNWLPLDNVAHNLHCSYIDLDFMPNGVSLPLLLCL